MDLLWHMDSVDNYQRTPSQVNLRDTDDQATTQLTIVRELRKYDNLVDDCKCILEPG